MTLRLRPAAAAGLSAWLAVACGGAPDRAPTMPAALPAPSAPGAARLLEAGARPNIVFILTDDQDASVENMPRLRSLVAEQGVTFERSFVSNPLCGPSRATLLTGLHAHTHGVLANRAPAGGFERFRDNGLENASVATWLRTAGYRTGIVGKYLNRYPGDAPGADRAYVPPGWDLFASFFAPDLTSGHYYDYFVNLDGRVTFYPAQPRDYVTDQITRVALGALDTLPAGGAPFFLHVTPNAPHNPPEPAPRHKGLFDGLKAPRVGAFDEADISDKPRYYQALPRFDARTIDKIDRLHAGRQETLQAVDELIEALVRRLDERGLLANTYIFFSSDNGFMLGQHRFPNGKDAPYEESIRVPLIVRGPGVPRGLVRGELVSNVDVPVTFADLAGAVAPASVEGRSFAALLRDGAPADAARGDLLIEHWADDTDAIPTYAGLRTPEYAYIEYETGEKEFYDLRSDPGQEENLADKADPALLASLAARLQVLRTCSGAGCR